MPAVVWLSKRMKTAVFIVVVMVVMVQRSTTSGRSDATVATSPNGGGRTD